MSILKILLLTLALWSSDAPSPAPSEEPRSSEESYATVAARVQGLEAKIKSSEGEIQKLLQEKAAAKPERVGEITVEVQHLHNKMQEQIREYDQQRSLLKYRYPDKGRTDKRVYERIDLKSLKQMEEEVGLSSALKRSLDKVRKHYGQPSNPAESENRTAKPKTKKDVLDPVILKK